MTLAITEIEIGRYTEKLQILKIVKRESMKRQSPFVIWHENLKVHYESAMHVLNSRSHTRPPGIKPNRDNWLFI